MISPAARKIRRIAIWALVFAGIGALLGFVAFMSGIADSGYPSPSSRTVILSSLALRPDYVCGKASPIVDLGVCDSFRSLGDKVPLLYLFGIPIVGWAIVGVFIALCKRRVAS